MDDPARGYDDLADWYHLIFQGWQRSIEWQAGVLGPLIERELPAGKLRILDCACGIGTQALGLAGRGHVLVGSDLSGGAIARAKREAQARRLAIDFRVADMRDLSAVPESDFDAVLAVDNAIPHLLNDEDLVRAARQIAGKLGAGGLFLATVRDYDQIVTERPAAPPPVFFDDGDYRRIYHQVWDWTSDRQYAMHLYITVQTAAGWECRHFVSVYRAVLRTEITAALRQAGFSEVRWLTPAESGFYQPVLMAWQRRETGGCTIRL